MTINPIIVGVGGGPVEKLPMNASRGSSVAPALAAVGDKVWDIFEPFADGVNLSYAFLRMSGITTVPAFDTSSVTNMASMFQSCTSLTEVPAFDTSRVTNMGSMFSGCLSLTEVPAISMATSTSLSNTFGQAGTAPIVQTTQLKSCTRFRAYGAVRGFVINGTKMSAEALNELMTNLGTAYNTSQTLDIRYNPGSATCDPSIATAKGWTVLTA